MAEASSVLFFMRGKLRTKTTCVPTRSVGIRGFSGRRALPGEGRRATASSNVGRDDVSPTLSKNFHLRKLLRDKLSMAFLRRARRRKAGSAWMARIRPVSADGGGSSGEAVKPGLQGPERAVAPSAG
jgi:hypothetical protein